MNILAVGPHPDDIEFGCAPVLIKEAKRGSRVKTLVLSRGESGSSGTPEIRAHEAREAAKLMGAEIAFLDFGGHCHIEYRPENSITIAAEIRQEKPDIVLAPNPIDNQHPDHVAVGKLVRDACRLARYGGVRELRDSPVHKIGALYFYNITVHSGRPEIVVDVSDVAAEWEAVIRCHQTQIASKGYFDLVTTSARALGLAAGVELAIGLFANDPICVRDLSELSRSAREF